VASRQSEVVRPLGPTVIEPQLMHAVTCGTRTCRRWLHGPQCHRVCALALAPGVAGCALDQADDAAEVRSITTGIERR
jgi:hypothetical protein